MDELSYLTKSEDWHKEALKVAAMVIHSAYTPGSSKLRPALRVARDCVAAYDNKVRELLPVLVAQNPSEDEVLAVPVHVSVYDEVHALKAENDRLREFVERCAAGSSIYVTNEVAREARKVLDV